jgi:hypothetical protein
MKILAKEIQTLLNSGTRENKLYALAYLKELGKLGKRLYKLSPEPWLRDYLIKIYKFIENYEI